MILPYEDAEMRIDSSEKLIPYKSFFLDDWPQGDEHYEWVAEAPEDQLLDWAKTIERGL